MTRTKEIKINREKNIVTRPLGLWTPQVHDFLHAIKANSFISVPEPISINYDTGTEQVSFVKGSVFNYPLPELAKSIETLKSSAIMLRRYHDISEEFALSKKYDNSLWKLPAMEPIEVMCHGDFAHYNVTLDSNGRALGIIDFDTCHPGPRSWDIAYALYRWSPMSNPNNQDGFGTLRDQATRANLFCNVYGCDIALRSGLPDMVVARLEHLVDFMEKESTKGNDVYTQNILQGHLKLYTADICYVNLNKQFFIDALTKLEF